MSAPAFLELDVVFYLHDQSVREYGGYHGVRDEGLLQTALNRARDRLGYEPETDLAALAAAYAFGIAKNHAFLDGNKRTAWACCQLFLKINGAGVRAPAGEAEENMVALATGGDERGGVSGVVAGVAAGIGGDGWTDRKLRGEGLGWNKVAWGGRLACGNGFRGWVTATRKRHRRAGIWFWTFLRDFSDARLL